MRPTLRAVFLFAAGIPLSLVLVLVDARLWPLALAYLGAAIFLTGVDALRAVPWRAMRIEVVSPDTLFIGDRDALAVDLTIADGWPATTVELATDVGPILSPPQLQSAVLVPGRRLRLSVPLVPTRRGTAHIYRLWLRWHGPWALMLRQRIHPVSATIPVVPNLRAVRHAAIQFSSRDAPFGFKPQSQQGEGSEFESLRDYVPGLDHRSIDWKHSARHRTLVCKQFRAERNHQIVLAFDTGHLMSEPLDGVPKLDRAINVGLLLGYVSLRSGDRVGLFGFDSQVRLFTRPIGGVHNFARLQRTTAQLEYRPEETNFTLGLTDLLSRLDRRTLVILQTEFVDTITAELMVENLERMAQRHLIIFVTLQDPALYAAVDAPPRAIGDMTRSVIADDFIRERLIVFERLRRLGVHCLDAPSETIDASLINRYLLIKRKELI